MFYIILNILIRIFIMISYYFISRFRLVFNAILFFLARRLFTTQKRQLLTHTHRYIQSISIIAMARALIK